MAKQTSEHRARYLPLIGADGVDAVSALVILVLGLGRTGMSFVRQVAQFPIQGIIAIDHDTVSERERGSVFPASTIERHKVHAARDYLKLWNPGIWFEPVLMKLSLETMSRLLECVLRAHVLVWAADDWPMLDFVSARLHTRIPMVGVAMSQQGFASEIAWSVPSLPFPLAQTLRASERVQASDAPNFPCDVDSAVNVALNVCLGMVLAGRSGFEHFQDYVDPRCPLLVAHNRANSFTRSSNRLVPCLTRLIPARRV